MQVSDSIDKLVCLSLLAAPKALNGYSMQDQGGTLGNGRPSILWQLRDGPDPTKLENYFVLTGNLERPDVTPQERLER
jgi:hypothetical protein